MIQPQSCSAKRRLYLFLVVVLALGPIGCQSMGPTDSLRAAIAESTAENRSPDARLIYHNNIGIALLEQFNHEKALEEFARCLAIRQDFLPAIVNSGLAHFYLQQLDQSEKLLKQALSLNDRQPTALFAMGLIHKNQDRLELALESFRKILLQDPQDPPTLYQVGQILLKREEYDQAERVLRRVVQLSPYDTAAHYSLAMSLLRGGNRDEGQKVMQKFLGLRESGGMSSTGTQYGEQGKYMLATGEYPDIKDLLPPPPSADAETPVRFSEVGWEAGLTLQPTAERQTGGSDSPTAVAGSSADPVRRRAARMGSGAAFGDYDGDGDLDLYLARCGPDAAQSGGLLYSNDGLGRFKEVSRQAGIDHRDCGMGAYWGDLDNDGHTDLFLTNYGANRLYRNLGDGTFEDVTAAAGVAGGDHWHLAAALADYDHDGDLDIYVGRFQDAGSSPGGESRDSPDNATATGTHLFRNNGKGVFADLAESAQVLAPGDRLISVVFTDFDNRRDVDFWTVAVGGPNRLYSNQRVGTFLDLGNPLDHLASLPAHSVSTADLDKDGRMDFLLGPLSGPLTWVRNLGKQEFRADELVFPGISTENRSWTSHAFDYDNDGDLDVLEVRGPAPGVSPKGSGLELYRNVGEGSFEAVTAESGLDRFRDRAFRSATLGDYDNDGDTDFLLTVSGGRPLLLRNHGGNRN
ncbi:MAG: FG-GAP-like repeat-containing protein, partial [Acidobacteria bacterium]|nr:FG-GAP-like repeat-containing protein [Acidobacteriota bacterium]